MDKGEKDISEFCTEKESTRDESNGGVIVRKKKDKFRYKRVKAALIALGIAIVVVAVLFLVFSLLNVTFKHVIPSLMNK